MLSLDECQRGLMPGVDRRSGPIKSVKSVPYLGLTINNKFQWSQHIDSISSAANSMLGFLNRAMPKCPVIKEKAYKSTVHPKLEYRSAIWDPHQQKYIDKLEMVQRRAARFVKTSPTSILDLNLRYQQWLMTWDGNHCKRDDTTTESPSCIK